MQQLHIAYLCSQWRVVGQACLSATASTVPPVHPTRYPEKFWGTPLVKRLTSHLAWVWIITQAWMAGCAGVGGAAALLVA